jgi:hypothetical protein
MAKSSTQDEALRNTKIRFKQSLRRSLIVASVGQLLLRHAQLLTWDGGAQAVSTAWVKM